MVPFLLRSPRSGRLTHSCGLQSPPAGAPAKRAGAFDSPGLAPEASTTRPLHGLGMIVATAPDVKDEARALWQEAKELNLIFGAILRGGKKD